MWIEWTWAVFIASAIATIANIYKKRWCFWVWLVTNSIWTAIDFYKEIYSQAALQAFYVGLAAWGIIKWRDGK